MQEGNKTKERLADELNRLHQLIIKLEESENQHRRALEQVRESEKKFRAVFNTAAGSIILVNKEGIIIDCNKGTQKVLGYTQEEIIGKSMEKLIHTYSLEEAQRCLREISAKEDSSNKEYKMIRKDGRLIDASVNSSSLRDEKGEFFCNVCFIEDITKRKQSEDALRDSKEKIQKLFESLSDGIFVIDLDGVYTEVNEKMLYMHGLSSKEEMLGKNFIKFVASHDVERARDRMQKILEQSKTTYHEYDARKADGSEFPVEVSGAVLKNVSGNPVGFIGIIRDITERKVAEEKIKESEEKFRNIFENVNDGMIFIDKHGKILEANKKAEQIYGRTKKDILGKHFTKLGILSSKSISMLMRNFKSALYGQTPCIHLSLKNKKGQEIDLECTTTHIRKDENITGLIVIIHDVTERKKREERIKESEEKYKSIFELAPDAIATMDLKGIITSCNSAFSNLTGYSQDEILNKHFSKLPGLPKSDIPKYVKIFKPLLKGKAPKAFETRWIHKDGTTRWGETRIGLIKKEGNIIGFQIIGRDITERKKAEK